MFSRAMAQNFSRSNNFSLMSREYQMDEFTMDYLQDPDERESRSRERPEDEDEGRIVARKRSRTAMNAG